MISLDLLLKHMQWANKEIYTEVSKPVSYTHLTLPTILRV